MSFWVSLAVSAEVFADVQLLVNREEHLSMVPGVAGAKVNMVFDPPWDQSRMSDEARAALDMW